MGIHWFARALWFAKMQRLLRISGVFKFEPCGGLKSWWFEAGAWVSLSLITQQKQCFPPVYEPSKPFLTSTPYKSFEWTTKCPPCWRTLLRATSFLKYGLSVFRAVRITFWDVAPRLERSFVSARGIRVHWSAQSRSIARRSRRYKVLVDLWKVQLFIPSGKSAPINELLLRTCEGNAESTFDKVRLPYPISSFSSLTP